MFITSSYFSLYKGKSFSIWEYLSEKTLIYGLFLLSLSLFMRSLNLAFMLLSYQLPSTTINMPSSFVTRIHSAKAFLGSGRVQSRYLLTTRSKLLSGNARSSASPCTNPISSDRSSAFLRAFLSIFSDRSTAVTLCPISARRSAKNPGPVPTSRAFRFLLSRFISLLLSWIVWKSIDFHASRS